MRLRTPTRPVIHRDVKPDNVLISGRHVFLAEFGVARAVAAHVTEDKTRGAGPSPRDGTRPRDFGPALTNLMNGDRRGVTRKPSPSGLRRRRRVSAGGGRRPSSRPYQIAELLGAGGMGEVYRARDSKLGRDVAIKILPAQFTADPERRARFAREARLLATLNHPHIGAIYGLEESDGVTALVLELVEGPTLADRLERGPLKVSDALAIARQIAEALEAAHEKGIVHRDLKPANIILQGAGGLTSSDARVKVLDFGLAKLVHADPEADATPSGTLQSTEDGRILGTRRT
jgi:serine/threonine protein kinase